MIRSSSIISSNKTENTFNSINTYSSPI
jgi:hypothetical protein